MSGSVTMKGGLLGHGTQHTKSMVEVPKTPILEQGSPIYSQRQTMDPVRTGSRSYSKMDAVIEKPSSKRYTGS